MDLGVGGEEGPEFDGAIVIRELRAKALDTWAQSWKLMILWNN